MATDAGDGLVVVVGCGRVGAAVAARLSAEGRDVVVLDRAQEAFRRLPVEFAGRTVVGDGTSLPTLRRVAEGGAAAFLALTRGDARNLMSAQIASRFLGVSMVVARIGNPERIPMCRELGVVPVCSTVLVAGACIEALLAAGVGAKARG